MRYVNCYSNASLAICPRFVWNCFSYVCVFFAFTRGRVVDLATNCYGCHVLQKALDCEEDIRLLIVSELLLGDPAQTLVNKHASHVWSKVRDTLFIGRTVTDGILDHGADMDATGAADFRVVSGLFGYPPWLSVE